MATKVINTILNLRDNMSGGLIKAARNTQGVSKEMVSATRSVVAFKNKAVSALGSATKSFVKWGAASAGAVTAAFLAMDNATEEYRVSQGKLNTAYESAGYSAQTAATAYNEFYKILGDTDTATEASQLLSKLIQDQQDVTQWTRVAAGVSGTFGDSLPIEGLIEASNETARTGTVTGVLADALNWASKEGETFGVTLRANTKANEEWNKAVNAAESAEDYFNLALQNCSSEAERNQLILDTLTGSYSDAADAFYKNNAQLVQARQNEAALATVTAKVGSASAIAKNGLMQLFGVQQDGSIRAGSSLAWLNDKADSLMSLFQQWSQDGTMDSLAQKFDQGLARGAELASQGFQWLQENGDSLLGGLKLLAGAIVGLKLMKLSVDTVKTVRDFTLFAKTVGRLTRKISANSANWIHNTAEMGINKAGLLAHTIATKAATAGTTALAAAQKLLNLAFVSTPIGWIVLGITGLIAVGVALYKNWDTVKAKAGELWEKVTSTFSGIKDSVVGAFHDAMDAAAGFFSWLDNKIEGIPIIGSIYKSGKNLGGWIAEKISGHATGTSYFSGGWTRVNERGGEIMRLPGGTQIIPHDVSERMVGGPSIRVYVTVQGNVIGNQAYAQELGDTIVARILRALRNT